MKEKIKNIIKRITIVCSLVASIIIVFSIVDEKPTFADSGFGTSYSSGGSSHSSSHSSSYSSHSRSSSHYRSGSSSYGGTDTSIFEMIFTIIFIIVMIIVFIYNRKGSNNRYIPQQYPTDDSTVENQIKQYIPNFNSIYYRIF